MHLKRLHILTGHEYFAEITEKIAATKPGDRVGLMSMSFDPREKRTEPLFHELIKAAKRGVRVQLNVDAYSFMVDDAKTLPTGPILKYNDVSRSHRADYRAKYETLGKLRAHGGQYCITNMPKRRLINPYAGRSHIKLCVINDLLYVGGSNLSKSWQVDLTVRVEDGKTADFAYDFMLRVAKAGNVIDALDDKDVSSQIDEATTFFIDAGRKRQSLIFEQALKLIDEAKEWTVITCQFFPASTTAEHLAAALKRGVKVEVHYFPSTISFNFLVGMKHYMVELGSKVKYPKALFEYPVDKDLPKLHAKLVATEQGAMIGSHNYVPQGINFGTAETAILRRNPEFARQAVATLKSSLDKPNVDKNSPKL